MCTVFALCAARVSAQTDAGIQLPALLHDDGSAGLRSGLRPGQTLQDEGAQSSACPRDEHGAVCALVSDEVVELQHELAELEEGRSTEGLCLAFTGLAPPQPTLEVVLSSPDGPADVGLQPSPQRVHVSGVTTLRREQVFGACALLEAQPARRRGEPGARWSADGDDSPSARDAEAQPKTPFE